MTKWSEHCREYAKQNGVSFRQALKDAKASYVKAERKKRVKKSKAMQQMEVSGGASEPELDSCGLPKQRVGSIDINIHPMHPYKEKDIIGMMKYINIDLDSPFHFFIVRDDETPTHMRFLFSKK